MLPRLSAQLRGAAVGAVLAVLPASPPPLGAQPASAPPLVLECARCHGFDGIGQDDDIPNLAGQHRAYLDRQVLAFRSGARRHPEMNFFARQASQDEFAVILDYYAGLRRR
jgi:cytochrome c553